MLVKTWLKDAIGFFGHLQKQSRLFSGSSQRWCFFKYVDLTFKSWSDTRWESRLQSVQAVRFQVAQSTCRSMAEFVYPVSKVEAQALPEELGSYRFLISSVVWCDILTLVNQVNNVILFQSSSMQLDVASNLITSTKAQY